MATQAIHVGDGSAVGLDPRRRSRAPGGLRLGAAIRWMAAVTLFALGACGMVAYASMAVAGTTPPEGPGAGLDQ